MSSTASSGPSAEPPARRLRLLANLWLPAALLCGLVALGALGVAVTGLVALLTTREPGRPVLVDVVGLVVGGLAAAVLGRITWRLAVEVPREVRAWEQALDERRRALRP